MEIEKEEDKKQVEGTTVEEGKNKNNEEDAHAMQEEKTNPEESKK